MHIFTLTGERRMGVHWRIREIKVHVPAYNHLIRKGCVCCRRIRQNYKESTKPMRTNRLRIIVVIAVLVVSGTVLGNAAAQKASVPKPQNKLAMGEDGIKQLLPLMNTDTKGMISKQEFMKFMEAEFERLDKSKKGELNAKELTQSSLTASRFAGK
jgi:hypothetical protein